MEKVLKTLILWGWVKLRSRRVRESVIWRDSSISSRFSLQGSRGWSLEQEAERAVIPTQCEGQLSNKNGMG